MEAARLLLDRGAAVDTADNDGWTPLCIASQYGHVEMVRLLLGGGAQIDAHGNRDEETPLWLACREGSMSVAQLLLERGPVNVNHTNIDGTSILVVARKHSEHAAELESLLIRNGASQQ